MIRWFFKICLIINILILVILFMPELYSHMTHLTEKDLEWISCYEEGDTVLFLSNRGNIDTMIIIDKGIRDTYNRLIPNEGVSSTFEASEWYDFVIFDNSKETDKIEGGLYVKKDYETDTLLFTTEFSRRFAFDVEMSNQTGNEFNNIFSKFSTNDSIPNNYLMFDDSNSHWSEIEWKKIKKVTHLVFNKSLGLIYYRYEDGEEFMLICEQ